MRRTAIVAVFGVLASISALGDQETPTHAPQSLLWTVPSPEVVRLLRDGTAEFKNGKLGSALKRFQEADALAQGRSWDAVVGIATAAIQSGRYAKARDAIERLLEGEPPPGGAGLAQQLLAMCFAAEHRLAEAEAAYEEALELRPGRPLSARIGLAAVLCSQGREEDGLALLDDDGLCAREGQSGAGAETEAGPPRFEVGGEITEPVKLSGSSPKYVEAARLAFVEGKVTLELIIGVDGAVRCVRVINGLPYGLSCSAAVAVASWRFQPAMEEGEPVECRYFLDVRFDLR